MSCKLCPRECGADRRTAFGYCNSPESAVVARAALHFWEEPCISGKRGSGAIFFSGCSMRCVFCQNSRISRKRAGREVSPKELAEIMRRLEGEGAHNINFVNPTHYVRPIISALEIYRPNIPVVYNTGGYDKEQTIDALNGICDIYLPDYKYADSSLAKMLSDAEDYPETAHKAISRMIAQTGKPRYDADGMMIKGTIIRHLILPGHIMNSLAVLRRISQLPEVPVSIMAQYTPYNELEQFPELNRRITQAEFNRVEQYAFKLGIDGFIQSIKSADACYIPDFDVREI